jgi:hypothetical protein
MMRSYYELDPADVPGAWGFLGLFDGNGRKLDARVFTYGNPVALGPPMRLPSYRDGTILEAPPYLQLPVGRLGKPLDFTFDGWGMPVVTPKVGSLLAAIADREIQRIPVLAGGGEDYEIINAASRVACIDTARSEIMWWTKDDGRPDKVGKPRMISKLVIDHDRAEGHHFFRLEGWAVALIVSDVVKKAFEEARVSGVAFKEV